MNACVSSAACGDALARRRLARAKLQGGLGLLAMPNLCPHAAFFSSNLTSSTAAASTAHEFLHLPN